MEMIMGNFSNPYAIFEDLKFLRIFRDIRGKSAYHGLYILVSLSHVAGIISIDSPLPYL